MTKSSSETIALNLNGYTTLPTGKVANIATVLEMLKKPTLKTLKIDGLRLEPLSPANLHRYKALFKAVGEEWLWFSRLTMSDDELEAAINREGTEIFAAILHGSDVGLLELDVRDKANIELAYFGLSASAIGNGIGRWLMNHAIARAFDHHQTKRFHVHTCTMDSPQALSFYMRSGFIPIARMIEVADDPRLSGHIKRQHGQHHPIIE